MSDMWDVKVVSDNGGWAYDLREAQDGVYWVTDTGNTLHLGCCGHLYSSANAIKDLTRTLAYRIKRGDVIMGPNRKQIESICWDCICCNHRRIPKLDIKRKPKPSLVLI